MLIKFFDLQSNTNRHLRPSSCYFKHKQQIFSLFSLTWLRHTPQLSPSLQGVSKYHKNIKYRIFSSAFLRKYRRRMMTTEQKKTCRYKFTYLSVLAGTCFCCHFFYTRRFGARSKYRPGTRTLWTQKGYWRGAHRKKWVLLLFLLLVFSEAVFNNNLFSVNIGCCLLAFFGGEEMLCVVPCCARSDGMKNDKNCHDIVIHFIEYTP